MPIGSIAYTSARPDWAVVDPDRATASLVGDFTRPRAVRAVPRPVNGGMLGQVPRVGARMCTLPHGRPKGVPRSPLVRWRRLLHGRIGPCLNSTVPQPRWSGISPGQQGPVRWTKGWRGLPKFCASPETLWFVGVIFNKNLRIYYRGGHVA